MAQEQAPPQAQPPPPPEGAAKPAGAARTVTRLISGVLDALSQRGHVAASSRSAMGRSTSNTARQSLQKYSYSGMAEAYRAATGGATVDACSRI